jgi:YbbR domain-containing protein
MDVKLGEKVSKVIENVPINYRNYSNNFKISTDEATSFYTNVTVYGTLTNVEKITMADLNVYVDFAGYGAGKHDIPINVEQNPSSLVSFAVDKTSIQMTLTDEKASSSDETVGG